MSLILDGPDGAGKSFLAQDLGKQGFRYEHHGLYPDDGPETLYRRYEMSIIAASFVETVVDRCYLSEFVYGLVMRGKCRLHDVNLAELVRLCNVHKVRQVICLPPWATAFANWTVKNEAKADYVDRADKYKKIYDMYDNLADSLGIEVYDYTTGEFK
jgi:hypothetical protein